MKRICHSELNIKETGKRIKSIRKKREMYQSQLADRCDTSREHICRIEKGRERPSQELIAKISRVLNVAVEELISWQ